MKGDDLNNSSQEDLISLVRSQMFDEGIDEIVANYERDRNELNRYFYSDSFKSTIKEIKKYDSLVLDDLLYGNNNKSDLSSDDFKRACEAIFYQVEKKNSFVKSDHNPMSKFEEIVAVYDGISFRLLIGQGSTYSTKLIEEHKESLNL